MTIVGKTHRFGQANSPEYHLLGQGSFPGDWHRLTQFLKRLGDLGATSQLETGEQKSNVLDDALFTCAGLHAVMKAMEPLSQRDVNLHDWLRVLGNGGFKAGANDQAYDAKRVTTSSQEAANAFLSRLLRLPLDLQSLVMTEIFKIVKPRMDDFETSGTMRGMNIFYQRYILVLYIKVPYGNWFTGIHKDYEVKIEKCVETSIGKECKVQLVSISRCLPFNSAMRGDSGQYMKEKESNGVLFAYMLGQDEFFAVYPFCSVPVSV